MVPVSVVYEVLFHGRENHGDFHRKPQSRFQMHQPLGVLKMNSIHD
jgi:hypothetical protein